MGRNVRCPGMAVLLLVLVVATAGVGAGAPVQKAWPLTVEPPPVFTRPAGSSGGLWRLTFSDEFDGPEVDTAKWANGFGWGDTAGNFAAWCDPTANTVVEGGQLLQRADRLAVPQNGKLFSGACLHTKHSFSQLYGYWEARIRVASGPGMMSAFWGKPADESWPPELDIEEIGGDRPDRVIMTNHWKDGGHRQATHRWRGPDFSAGFHVFGAEWSPERIVWYVDGEERARTTSGAAQMAAGGPFYALLNLQVGLRGAAQATDATRFPAFQLVDYVRIWDRPFTFLGP